MRLKRNLALGLGLALSACVAQPPEAQLATACEGLASGYWTAAGYVAQGKFSQDTIKLLVDAEGPALVACDKANPPTDLNKALAAVLDAAQKVALANAGVK